MISKALSMSVMYHCHPPATDLPIEPWTSLFSFQPKLSRSVRIKAKAEVLIYLFVCLFVYLFIIFLEPHPQHMEVPRLGVKLQL